MLQRSVLWSGVFLTLVVGHARAADKSAAKEAAVKEGKDQKQPAALVGPAIVDFFLEKEEGGSNLNAVVTHVDNDPNLAIGGDKNNVTQRIGVFGAKVTAVVKMKGAVNDDLLLLQHKIGKKKLGKPIKCNVSKIIKGDDVVVFECAGQEQASSKKPGKYATEFTYKSVETSKTYENFAEIQYTVFKHQCDVDKKAICFDVDSDARLGEGWITLRPKSDLTKFQFRLWMKRDSEEFDPSKSVLRCFFNDKKIADTESSSGSPEWEFKFFDKKGNQKRTSYALYDFDFSEADIVFKIAPKNEFIHPKFVMMKNPGDYRCVATNNGDEVFEFKFSVDKTGVVKKTCQLMAEPKGIHGIKGHVFVPVTFKSGFATKYDKKAFAKSAFFARGVAAECLKP